MAVATTLQLLSVMPRNTFGFTSDEPMLEFDVHNPFRDELLSKPFELKNGRIEVPTVSGRVQLTVPKGTSSGRVFRLRGKGVKNTTTGATGVMSTLANTINGFTADQTSLISGRIASFGDESKEISDQETAMQTRIDAYQTNLQKQFAAMELVVQQYKNEASALDSLDNTSTSSSSSSTKSSSSG